MTFVEALRKAAKTEGDTLLRVSRDTGPSFLIDALGQLRPESGRAYLDELLNLADWHLDTLPPPPKESSNA